GFTQKTPQGKNQPAQTAQEAASASAQEAHVAEVICRTGSFVRSRACIKAGAGRDCIFDARQFLLMEHRFDKHYTRDEARALLPQIRQWLEQLHRLRQDLE